MQRRKKEKRVFTPKVYIYGRHALIEALTGAPHAVKKVFLSPRAEEPELMRLLHEQSVPTAALATGHATDLVGKEAVHQGVIGVVDPTALLLDLDTFLESLDLSTRPAVALLAEVQDPHNVGAIIRSAAAFGLSAVLLPEHRQAGVSGAVVKTSAGMTFRVPLVSIGNVHSALEKLKAKGFWIYGLSTQGATALSHEAFDAPSVFVVGNEGAGIREKTLEACDVALSIPIHPRTESLNAAASAAVVFYAWSQKHEAALH